MKKLYLILVTLLALAACNGHIDVLDRAEACIEDNPELALQILDSLDSDAFHLPHQKARYSLLKSMALSKNYIDTTDFSIIKPAFDYYRFFGRRKDKCLAYFYYSEIFSNNERYTDALLYLYKALKYAGRDLKTKILIYSSMEYVYSNSHLTDEALKSAELLYDAVMNSGDTSKFALVAYTLALEYHNKEMFDKSDSLCNMVFKYTDSLSYSGLSSLMLQADNMFYGQDPDYSEIVSKYNFALSYGGEFAEENYYDLAYALVRNDDIDAAEEILSNLDTSKAEGNSLYSLAKLEEYRMNYKKSLEYLYKYMDYEEVYIKKKLSQSIYRAQAENYRLQSELEVRSKWLVVILSLFVLLMFSMIFILVYRNIKSKNKGLQLEKEQLESEIENIVSLRKVYKSMFRTSFNTSDYKDGNGRGLIELKNRLNDDLDNVVTKISEDFPDLKESDILFICCLIAGFENVEIASLLNLSKDNVRTKKSRLKKMILKSKSLNTTLYKYVF